MCVVVFSPRALVLIAGVRVVTVAEYYSGFYWLTENVARVCASRLFLFVFFIFIYLFLFLRESESCQNSVTKNIYMYHDNQKICAVVRCVSFFLLLLLPLLLDIIQFVR